MQFDAMNKAICWFFLIFAISCEGLVLFKNSQSLQSEIIIKKIDILNDRPGVINLLPGVGKRKLEQILELRKTEKSASVILEKVGLSSSAIIDEDSISLAE